MLCNSRNMAAGSVLIITILITFPGATNGASTAAPPSTTESVANTAETVADTAEAMANTTEPPENANSTEGQTTSSPGNTTNAGNSAVNETTMEAMTTAMPNTSVDMDNNETSTVANSNSTANQLVSTESTQQNTTEEMLPTTQPPAITTAQIQISSESNMTGSSNVTNEYSTTAVTVANVSITTMQSETTTLNNTVTSEGDVTDSPTNITTETSEIMTSTNETATIGQTSSVAPSDENATTEGLVTTQQTQPNTTADLETSSVSISSAASTTTTMEATTMTLVPQYPPFGADTTGAVFKLQLKVKGNETYVKNELTQNFNSVQGFIKVVLTSLSQARRKRQAEPDIEWNADVVMDAVVVNNADSTKLAATLNDALVNLSSVLDPSVDVHAVASEFAARASSLCNVPGVCPAAYNCTESSENIPICNHLCTTITCTVGSPCQVVIHSNGTISPECRQEPSEPSPTKEVNTQEEIQSWTYILPSVIAGLLLVILILTCIKANRQNCSDDKNYNMGY